MTIQRISSDQLSANSVNVLTHLQTVGSPGTSKYLRGDGTWSVAVDPAQANNITAAFLAANAAFLQANTANTTANNLFRSNFNGSGTIRVTKAPFSTNFYFPELTGQNNPTLVLIAGQSYAFDLNDPDIGNYNMQFRLRTNLSTSNGSAISNVTHVGMTGGVTKDVTGAQVQGTLYWTPSRNLVGNTTLVYDHANYSSTVYGSIVVVDPQQIPLSYNHANAAFVQANTALTQSNTAASTGKAIAMSIVFGGS